jgi:hypothetical protein
MMHGVHEKERRVWAFDLGSMMMLWVGTIRSHRLTKKQRAVLQERNRQLSLV